MVCSCYLNVLSAAFCVPTEFCSLYLSYLFPISFALKDFIVLSKLIIVQKYLCLYLFCASCLPFPCICFHSTYMYIPLCHRMQFVSAIITSTSLNLQLSLIISQSSAPASVAPSGIHTGQQPVEKSSSQVQSQVDT